MKKITLFRHILIHFDLIYFDPIFLMWKAEEQMSNAYRYCQHSSLSFQVVKVFVFIVDNFHTILICVYITWRSIFDQLYSRIAIELSHLLTFICPLHTHVTNVHKSRFLNMCRPIWEFDQQPRFDHGNVHKFGVKGRALLISYHATIF